jgi:hypothetical protein
MRSIMRLIRSSRLAGVGALGACTPIEAQWVAAHGC